VLAQLMLEDQQYDLAAEVLRFPAPPTANEQMMNSATDAAEEQWPRGVRSTGWPQDLPAKHAWCSNMSLTPLSGFPIVLAGSLEDFYHRLAVS
jgi:hypothetical protein